MELCRHLRVIVEVEEMGYTVPVNGEEGQVISSRILVSRTVVLGSLEIALILNRN